MLLLMRHGHAVGGPADELRWLSESGRAEVATVARALRDGAPPIDAIVSSPLVRAVQTAGIVAEIAGFRGDRTASHHLRPEGDWRSAIAEVEALGAVVLAVSHEPLVSGISAQLGATRHFRTAEVRGFDSGKMVFRQLP